jgi:protein-S-isoprenylcysteine O-methyltransferase Ste14
MKIINFLELKIPPPLVAIVCVAILIGVDRIVKLPFDLGWWRLPLSGLLVVIGLIVLVLGVFEFRRSRTTVNPMSPQLASHLVTSGIYRWTRNSMYLGFYLWVLAVALYLQNGVAIATSFLFIIYINRFQILPEERVLTQLFNDEYQFYQQCVRRWL